jgi:hypothetical protein
MLNPRPTTPKRLDKAYVATDEPPECEDCRQSRDETKSESANRAPLGQICFSTEGDLSSGIASRYFAPSQGSEVYLINRHLG